MTLLLQNQYELESMSSYSGSFTDHLFYGNMFSQRKTYSGTTKLPDTVVSVVDFRRGAIASTINDNINSTINLISNENKTMWFSDYLNIVYGRYIPSKTSNFCTQFNDFNEYYFDSYVPNFFEIHKLNGGIFVGNVEPFTYTPYSPSQIASVYSGSRRTIGTNQYIEDFDVVEYGYGTKSTGKTNVSNSLGIVVSNINMGGNVGSSPFANIQDNDWRHIWPHSYKYKNLTRNFRPNRNLRKPEVITYNLDGSAATNPFIGSLFCTMQIYTSGTRVDPNTYFSSPFTTNREDIQQVMDMVISGSEASYVANLFINDEATAISEYRARMSSFRMKDMLNVYFGLGKNGLVYNPWSQGFLARNSPEFIAEALFASVAPIIRGFKYGMYSANPLNTKAYWRRGRYGQFRDRLEQRQYTKFRYDHLPWPQVSPTYPVNTLTPKKTYNPQNTKDYTSDAIVKVTFVTGTEASEYWENYNEWNPDTDSITTLSNSYGSGMFDFEYKATQPFIDRDS